MKKIFNYIAVALSVILAGGLFTACHIEEAMESADLGLGIKVFFPTKVVAGQPMTINGSGFSDVTEIEFPGGVKAAGFELVSNEMIRVVAPAGIAAEGGVLKVRNKDGEVVESRVPLTLGKTAISGFSKQDGEKIGGGEQLTIFGQDLEFISSVELQDADGNPLVLQDEDFYRKGTSSVIITIPKKGVFEGTFVGYLRTIDGQVFPLPELEYAPAAEGGHWETQEIVIWEGSKTSTGFSNVDDMGTEDDWANAEIAEGDVIRIYFSTTDPENWAIQLFGLHWGAFNHAADGTNKFTNATNPTAIKDGYLEIPVSADIVAELTEKAYWGAAMIWQGDPEVTVTKMTLAREVWVDGGGDQPVEVEEVLFEGESVFDSWSATMVIEAGLFADVVEGAVITVTIKDKGDDYNPIFKHVSDWSDWTELQGAKVDADNNFSAVIPAEAIDELKASGLRFQGLGFTVVKVTLKTWKTVGPVTDKVLYDGDPVVYDSWSATQIVTGFNDVAEGFIIRVTIKDKGDDYNPIFKHVSDWSDWTELQSGKIDTDTGFETVVPAEAIDELKASGLRFQGLGFTIVKVELIVS
jgi:hypothetical protein